MAEHKKLDVKERLDNYRSHVTEMSREASYDYCYGYFQTHRHYLAANMEISCLQLWSYLASWGMLRGSSALLNYCNMKVLSEIITYLDRLTDDYWELDLPDYKDEEHREKAIKVYKEIKTKLSHPTETLITKIMMATIGCVPALDGYFAEFIRDEFKEEVPYCGFRSVTHRALKYFNTFYVANQNDFVSYQQKCRVVDFNGNPTNFFYTKAKLLDMYGWNKAR